MYKETHKVNYFNWYTSVYFWNYLLQQQKRTACNISKQIVSVIDLLVSDFSSYEYYSKGSKIVVIQKNENCTLTKN